MFEEIVSFFKSKPSNFGVELNVKVDINNETAFSIRTMIVGHTHRSLDAQFAQLLGHFDVIYKFCFNEPPLVFLAM